MRFANVRFPHTATCLDIGCGEGANTRELAIRGNRVFSIDKDPLVPAPVPETPAWHVCADICEYKYTTSISGLFDLIYDVNTLCHVKDPPFEKIRDWLKPNGSFFSICPTDNSPTRITEGKDFTRMVSEQELRMMLLPFFADIRIFYRMEPDFRGNRLESWLVEAKP